MLTSEEVKDRVVSYHGQNNRKEQNAIHLYVCLTASLTKGVQDIIVYETNSYTVTCALYGPSFLRAIITCASTDIRATSTQIRISLSKLDAQMLGLNSDILLFNEYVN